jgi:hypothetical protein
MDVADHFADVSKTIAMPKSAEKEVVNYMLTRYACYLDTMVPGTSAPLATFQIWLFLTAKFHSHDYQMFVIWRTLSAKLEEHQIKLLSMWTIFYSSAA